MRADVSLDRVEGALLGCALGDALGLPCEGLSQRTLARRFGLDRFGLLGRTGFVSDDTEQTALVAEALALGDTPDAVERVFRARLRWWFARLPFGIGLATLRACLKLWLGLSRSGVDSAGNGAAMRAGIVGVVVGDAALRRALVERLSRVTHAHPLGVEGAVYVAEVAAHLARGAAPEEAVQRALGEVTQAAVRNAVEHAVRLAGAGPARGLGDGATRDRGEGDAPGDGARPSRGASAASGDGARPSRGEGRAPGDGAMPSRGEGRAPGDSAMPSRGEGAAPVPGSAAGVVPGLRALAPTGAGDAPGSVGLAPEPAPAPAPEELEAVSRALGTTGFVVHSVGACTWSLLTARDAMDAIRRSIRLGGDTDTHAAIVGAWAGAAWGPAALEAPLLEAIHDGPFGPTHLRGLARALVGGTPPPRWSAPAAMARNLALYPVVLAHGFRRLVPLG